MSETTAQAIEIDHLGEADDDFPETLNPLRVMLIRSHGDENADTQIQLVCIEKCNAPLDVARAFELLDATPTRRGTQANAISQVLHGKAAVYLECRENFAVELVEHSCLR
jgi:hypothetical protein